MIQAACGETQAAQFSRWGLDRRSTTGFSPRRCAPLIVAFRSEYIGNSTLTRLVRRALPAPRRSRGFHHRLLAAALTFLVAKAAASFAAEPAFETTVELPSPERAVVRTRIPSGSHFAGASGFHGLSGDPEQGWRRAPMRFDRVPNGGLVFESRVEAGVDGWLRIPIPIPDTPPPAGTDLSFAAEITPPPGYRIVDAFPSGTSGKAAGGALHLLLPAPPSFLRFRVVPEDAIGIGLAGVVDGILAVLFIGLAVFGARRLLGPSAPGGSGSP